MAAGIAIFGFLAFWIAIVAILARDARKERPRTTNAKINSSSKYDNSDEVVTREKIGTNQYNTGITVNNKITIDDKYEVKNPKIGDIFTNVPITESAKTMLNDINRTENSVNKQLVPNSPSKYLNKIPIEKLLRDTDYDDDLEYQEFVNKMWSAPNRCPVSVTLHRKFFDGSLIECRLNSIVTRRDGGCYVNLTEGGVRKTLVSDRQKWWRAGAVIHSDAFRFILSGIDADVALRPELRPRSIAEALAKNNDHFQTNKRRFVICYSDKVGNQSYRVVSGVRRSHDRFTAHCHFRWGELRHFQFSGLKMVIDAATGEIIPIERFIDASRPLGLR